MKNVGKTKLYLDLQIKYLTNGIFIHPSAYTVKVLKIFYMNEAHSLSTLIIVRSLDVKRIHFDLKKN